MVYIVKKAHVLLIALMLTVICQVHADYGFSADGCGDCCCEPVCCGKGFITADVLYWRAFQDGLDKCFPIEDCDCIFSSYGQIRNKFKGRSHDPHFEWDAGYRVGAGFCFSSDWTLAAFWTHFHSRSTKHNKDNYIFDKNENKIKWKLDFEVADALILGNSGIGSCATLRPYAGVRWARIEQKLRRDLNSELSPSYDVFFSNPNFARSDVDNKQKFWGVGPVIGAEAEYNLGCGLSLYANASFAVLYGHFHVRIKNSDEFRDGYENCHITRHLEACQAVVDAGLGIRWEKCFCDRIYWLQLGLEHHRYFNQNRFGDYGDLCLDGGNFSAGFAF